MNATVATPDGLEEWLGSLPLVEGVRPVDRLPAVVRTQTFQPTYRRQAPPSAMVSTPPEQEIISLVRESGILRWRIGVSTGLSTARGAAGSAALQAAQVIKQYAFEKLDTSKISSCLSNVDELLIRNPVTTVIAPTGLLQLNNGSLEPLTAVPSVAGKRVLLFIHDIMSRSETLIANGLGTTQAGRDLLGAIPGHYDFVLAYDHATLSVSPTINAFDLVQRLRPAPAALDIICHGRGGLVARWLCEGYSEPSVKRRVVFVGSPLTGTSLAAAARLRSTLDLFTNIADVLRTGDNSALASPFFIVANVILRILSTITKLAAETAVLDTVLALIPGLHAMSIDGNAQELNRLDIHAKNASFDTSPLEYFAIQSNFKPQDIRWNSLRLFCVPMQMPGDRSTDIIFQSASDLLVDTQCMREVSSGKSVRVIHDFRDNSTVHHMNYFQQPETATAVRNAFGIS
jgi:hypothetical protein